MQSFRPKDEDEPPSDGGRNPEVDFRRERRSNDTHQSTADPDARLAKKGKGKEVKLCFGAHVLMDNREGLAGGLQDAGAPLGVVGVVADDDRDLRHDVDVVGVGRCAAEDGW